jgi:hypothetical protein
MTVEHLLLALLDNSVALDVLRKVGADVDKLRGRPQGVHRLHHAADSRWRFRSRDPADPGLPAGAAAGGVPRAVLRPQGSHRRQRAGGHLQRAGKPGGFLLKQQNIARIDVVNYIAHGISKVAGEAGESAPAGPGVRRGGHSGEGGQQSALEALPPTSTSRPRPGASIRWSAAMPSSSGSSRCCAGGARTTRCWSASPASARRPSPRGWPSASSTARCPEVVADAPSTPWTWARCWPAPSTAAISRSASRWCSPSSRSKGQHPVHRRGAHHHRRRRRLRRRHGRLQPAQAAADLR